MKVAKFLRDIILMLYVCVFILCLICYFLGITAAPVTSANQFSNIGVGNLVLFKSGEFFGSLPWFGHAITWIKTIPGIIISSLFTILIFGTFIFELVRDKKKKKNIKDNEVSDEVTEEIENTNSESDFTEEDINKAKEFFSKSDEHIENERLIEEFDEQRLEEPNASEEPIVEEVTEDIKESIEENVEEDIVDNEDVVEDIEDVVEDNEAVEESNEQSISNGKDEGDNMMFDNEKSLNFDESILDKYFTENIDDVTNQYMDNSVESLPDELIENIEKNIDDKVYEAKHSVEELSQIPDSISRDTSDFEQILNAGDLYDNVDYHQMSLADLEAASEDPVLSEMDFTNHSEVVNEVPNDFIENLKKELELKTEEVNILKDKLITLENIDMEEVSSKLKVSENEKSELAKEVTLKDKMIAELNENLNTSNVYVKEVENALNMAIDERESVKNQLKEYEDTVSKYNEIITESNEKMDKYIDKYNLMYERYISTIEYLVKKGLASEASIDREKDTFNMTE